MACDGSLLSHCCCIMLLGGLQYCVSSTRKYGCKSPFGAQTNIIYQHLISSIERRHSMLHIYTIYILKAYHLLRKIGTKKSEPENLAPVLREFSVSRLFQRWDLSHSFWFLKLHPTKHPIPIPPIQSGEMQCKTANLHILLLPVPLSSPPPLSNMCHRIHLS